nr:probable LRR receptor-like serine/threonine-protein kinase At1g51880 [Ipomoea trifida]
MSPLLILSLVSLFSFSAASLPYPFTYNLHIDCGGHTNSTDDFNTAWLADRYYTGGDTAIVSEPLQFKHQQEKTLRYFPIASGKKNCYVIPDLPAGKYLLRTFTVYDNFDGKSHSPSFDVSVEGNLVFSWRSPWTESVSRSGAYSDLFFTVADSEADICFYSIATDSPVIASLELTQVDPESYLVNDSTIRSSLNTSILVNYGRFSSGSEQWGPGFSNDTDRFGRSWQSDAEFRFRNTEIENGGSVKAISAIQDIVNVDKPPNYFPLKLYQTAVTVVGEGHEFLEYILPVDAKLDYLLCFHFAEIDVSVNRKGKRVFDVVVNGENVTRVDIYEKVGGFAAYDWNYVVKNLNSTTLNVRLVPVVGAPVICGLENYAIVPADLRTAPDQAVAMKALKESLRVPDRMGWNGDPCAPTTWDAWEGVTCRQPKGESRLVISQIDLGSQGLKGYISDKISLLSNLVSLNLSSNSLGGSLPQGIGQKSLVKLDLSNNKFTGFIPDSFTSSSLQLMLLNGNSLEGRVPSELYSIGVHGGAIDLSDNKGLCGVPSLPDCSLFWDKHGLSTAGKVGIGIVSLVIFLLLLCLGYWCYKRRQNDYDFGLPHELMSLSAKRNRYHRQKSLMALEMESQHAKGFIPSYNSN